jgi:NADH:ubiquinone oxidoreductase subunit 6 (subunit J)|nr:hypothetical protein [Actinophrys sol]
MIEFLINTFLILKALPYIIYVAFIRFYPQYSLFDIILFGILIFILCQILFIYYTNNIVMIILSVLSIFILTGILFIILGSEYLAFMFLIIYGGAIVILFICCFMLMSFKNTKIEKNLLKNIIFMLFSIIFLFLILNSILNFVCGLDSIKYAISFFTLYKLVNIQMKLKYFNFYFFQDSSNLIDLSSLSKIGYILYSESWFETLFLGLFILLAIIFIINLFKR